VAGTINYYRADGTLLESDVLAILGQGKAEIFSENIPSEAASAVVCADGDLAGYARFGNSQGQRYAIPGSIGLGTSIAIPWIANNANWRTGIGLHNPTGEEVTITIIDDSGAARENILGAKAQYFFWVEAGENPNHITASGNIAAVEIFESLASGGDRAGIMLGNPRFTELCVPIISFADGDWTGVGLRNGSSWDGTVTAFGHKSSGVVEEAFLGPLPAYSRLAENLSGIFGTDTLWAKIGGVAEIETPVGPLQLPLHGLGVYGEGGLNKLGAVSLNALRFKDGIFGIADSGVSPTFALLNPGAVDANITATAYDSDGMVVGSDTMTIGAGTTTGGSLDSLVGGITLGFGTYIQIVSDVDLYGFETIYANGRMEILPILK